MQNVLLGLQVIVGAVAAIYIGLQLREMRLAQQRQMELEKRKTSLDFIARFNSDHIIELRAKALHAHNQGKTTDDQATHDVLAYLNFFEEMALVVRNGMAEEQICYQYLRQPVLETCSRFEQAFTDNPGRYPALRELRDNWASGRMTVPLNMSKLSRIVPLEAYRGASSRWGI